MRRNYDEQFTIVFGAIRELMSPHLPRQNRAAWISHRHPRTPPGARHPKKR